MAFTTLISTAELAAHLDSPDWAVIDCRFVLTDPPAGRAKYLAAHIPGAVYAHMDEDLSGPMVPGKTGRHPLPPAETFAQVAARLGIDDKVQVVAYDDNSGAFAARLWWMLRWVGHDAVAVLDGDWRAWQREGRPVREGGESRAQRHFVAHVRPETQISAAQLAAQLHDPHQPVFDARGAERYRGENETLDPVAGHIPGAISAPYVGNLDTNGYFLSAEALRARWLTLLAGQPAEKAVVYCGSGVTAIHDLIALQHAGLGQARLYPGSWSDWITDPARPIATGAERG
jgi:thiosulfate/3-mercaptopyruvate sulfurtransferase